MEITSISITPTPNRKRQIADVSIVFERSLLINNIRLINNGKKVFVKALCFYVGPDTKSKEPATSRLADS